MPRPKNFREESKNFGSRKSKDKQDFLGKKKTETESSLGKTSKSKDFDSAQKLKEKRISDTSEKTEEIAEQGTTNEKTAEKEYPNVDLGIDIFSQVNENSKIKDLNFPLEEEYVRDLKELVGNLPDYKQVIKEVKEKLKEIKAS